MSEPADVSVTLAEIARIVGVGRAAVSNWRRRHADFPTPVGGTDSSPQFSLAAVERWLQVQGKVERIGKRERLWPQFEALGDRAAMGGAIARAGELVLAGRAAAPAASVATPSAPAARLVEQAVETAHHEGGRETFDFLLERWLDAHVRQISATPEPLADMMVALSAVVMGAGPKTVLDPACGSGGLLRAAAERWNTVPPPGPRCELLGVEIDPTLAALASARLGFIEAEAVGPSRKNSRSGVDIREGDSLRSDPHTQVRADVVLSNPPSNERDWGHEELATDPRWVFGLPPRTEPELAWVQHALARLRPGGTAVLLLPPAVASRRAGRRIRRALLRAGALRGVIALPAGAAQPHSVSLHLWILRAPATEGEPEPRNVFMMDATTPQAGTTGRGQQGIEWGRLRSYVMEAASAFDWRDAPGSSQRQPAPGCLSVPVMDLMDDQVDLTPARYVPDQPVGAPLQLTESLGRFGTLLREVGEHSCRLADVNMAAEGEPATMVTVGDLERARALSLQTGQPFPAARPVAESREPGHVPTMTVADLLQEVRPGGQLSAEEVQDGVEAGALTVAAPGDVVVVGVERAFRAWVQQDTPLVIGPQLYVLRSDPAVIDPWFLAGCLCAPANVRQASSHTSTSARIDVRKLQVLQLPPAEQRFHADAFRELMALEQALRSLGAAGEQLLRDLRDGLVSRRLGR